MAAKTVQWEQQGRIGRIQLSRPDKLNALDVAMLEELNRIVEAVSRDTRGVRAVVIEGEGRAFCAGADLKERRALHNSEQIRAGVAQIKAVFDALARLPQPTIAAMNGLALGGGLELALSCDFRYAVRGAMLGLTEVSLGIIPGAGGTQRLPRLIGAARAKELILTGRRITAEQAYDWGIVSGLADDREQLHAMCLQLANETLANAPLAVYQAKAAINRGAGTDLRTALAIETEEYEALLPTKDRAEALEAFHEKRPPRFSGE
ncbi:enoyl-CoA hydratase-related protein [Paenibacillus sp. R14(2021)]|uniref:enoyl-CoA hydratase-related protein n=1 Tax=Paenibacillus sp. R14(2021) TaxID=2859228 RepID=UPI001C6153C9|nr:enoyl-CoA hydratase-related protein [Paenibacillus sp. R14(2021)]